ncbi:MAG: hypothetical protein HQ510_11400 [Candidatus Marinimicrobia bacterium]|nr:hypothetical protein [Candidatus Neomarinimicrobiota bacterium]
MMKPTVGKIIFGLSVLAVITVMIIGIIIIESPSEIRNKKIDRDTVHELRLIQITVDRYWLSNNVLPPDLITLVKESGPRFLQDDSEVQGTTSYSKVDSTTYKLCAIFLTNSFESNDLTPQDLRPGAIDWRHMTGRFCYTLQVRDDMRR